MWPEVLPPYSGRSGHVGERVPVAVRPAQAGHVLVRLQRRPPELRPRHHRHRRPLLQRQRLAGRRDRGLRSIQD